MQYENCNTVSCPQDYSNSTLNLMPSRLLWAAFCDAVFNAQEMFTLYLLGVNKHYGYGGYSYIYPPVYIARYLFSELVEQRRMNELTQGSNKRQSILAPVHSGECLSL